MKIITNGLNLYPLRSDSKKEPVNLIELPPVYNAFVNLYELGQQKAMNSESYLDERYNEKLGIARVVFEPNANQVTLGALYTPIEATEIEDRVFDEDDSIKTMNVRLVGEDATGHYLYMVGIGDDNKDIVFLESSDLSFQGGERLTKISNNIFEFMSSFKIVEIDEGIGYDTQYEQLYKNWGEDFWRIKNFTS